MFGQEFDSPRLHFHFACQVTAMSFVPASIVPALRFARKGCSFFFDTGLGVVINSMEAW